MFLTFGREIGNKNKITNIPLKLTLQFHTKPAKRYWLMKENQTEFIQ